MDVFASLDAHWCLPGWNSSWILALQIQEETSEFKMGKVHYTFPNMIIYHITALVLDRYWMVLSNCRRTRSGLRGQLYSILQ